MWKWHIAWDISPLNPCETTFMKPRGKFLQSEAITKAPVLHWRNLGVDSAGEQLVFGEERQYSIPYDVGTRSRFATKSTHHRQDSLKGLYVSNHCVAYENSYAWLGSQKDLKKIAISLCAFISVSFTHHTSWLAMTSRIVGFFLVKSFPEWSTKRLIPT